MPGCALSSAAASVEGGVAPPGGAVPPEPGVAVGAARTLFDTFATQITRDPPPLAEPLHWLIVTAKAGDCVPTPLQVSPTRVPPLAEPLHWVIIAGLSRAGNGSQPVVSPSPEPTHWLTVAAVGAGSTPTKLLMTRTLQRSVPPLLMDPLHWVTEVTGCVRTVV